MPSMRVLFTERPVMKEPRFQPLPFLTQYHVWCMAIKRPSPPLSKRTRRGHPHFRTALKNGCRTVSACLSGITCRGYR